MSESSQQPSQAVPESAGTDDVIAQYELACAEMRGVGQKLHRQMQEYQSVLDEVARLEATDTPQAREKLQRLEALVHSEDFRRDEREIRRMSAALTHSVERLMADSPMACASSASSPTSPTSALHGDAKPGQPIKRAPFRRRTCA
ncbi:MULTISPECIES: hypothetical protein [Pandoraea]|uniref:hypothetical protein n=1 Tax=Pandoraea TaxID=93217 RepID=UPI001F5D1249|nr:MULTISPECIES: hypothetical protein [Pandoraea]MCI3204927.1 hypothetical protein [Pandoraea sp. LA3]MDN4582955.1 hypothetical protein [Pandoraea capi]